MWPRSPARLPQLTAEEQKAIIAGFDDPSGLQAGGVRANGKKFFTLGVTQRTIYGKQGVSPPPLLPHSPTHSASLNPLTPFPTLFRALECCGLG